MGSKDHSERVGEDDSGCLGSTWNMNSVEKGRKVDGQRRRTQSLLEPYDWTKSFSHKEIDNEASLGRASFRHNMENIFFFFFFFFFYKNDKVGSPSKRNLFVKLSNFFFFLEIISF